MMQYKGYYGHAEYDAEARIFHGDVIGISDVITFQGTTVDELEEEFHTSVDVYLEHCAEIGKRPEKSYSGRFNVRISPDLHAALALYAKREGDSLNGVIEKILSQAVL